MARDHTLPDALRKANGPQAYTCGPFGGLLWIYQEVVTLRVPNGNFACGQLRLTPGLSDCHFRPDLTPNGNPTHRSSCEALRATALSLSHLTWSMGTSI